MQALHSNNLKHICKESKQNLRGLKDGNWSKGRLRKGYLVLLMVRVGNWTQDFWIASPMYWSFFGLVFSEVMLFYLLSSVAVDCNSDHDYKDSSWTICLLCL